MHRFRKVFALGAREKELREACLLFTVYYLLFTIYCLLFTVYCLLITDYWLLSQMGVYAPHQIVLIRQVQPELPKP